MPKPKNNIRTRFAPSPTGYLHIGGLRTALFAYLTAKKNKGVFVLRLEDTDQTREVKGAIEGLITVLNKVGLTPDEGVILDKNKQVQDSGKYGPYIQSQRLDLYQATAQELIKQDKAYYCFCSPERLTKLREDKLAKKQVPKYDGHCRSLDKTEALAKIKAGESAVIRFKIPNDTVVEADDLIYGHIKVKSQDLDDFVILKSDGFPTYHLAHPVDDHTMKISHVIRGEEWLPSLPKHVLLFRSLGYDLPIYVHLPLILNPDKSKLSKRQGDVAVEDFLAKGYLVEALLNYVALLGWNPGTDQEIFSLDQLVKNFSLEKINKSGAVFDLKKLQWLNSHYIKNIVTENKKRYQILVEETKKFLPDHQDKVEDLLKLFSARLNYLAEIKDLSSFIFTLPEYPRDMLIFKKSDQTKTKQGLESAKNLLEGLKAKDWTTNTLNKALEQLVKAQNLAPGDVFWPIRVSLSGLEKSPSPAEILAVLGKEESLRRIGLGIGRV
ncbi:MAG: glutamate--tRNA ligase [Patescibacteria group bacterium]|jgi:nondiscriminating glutamyl-tRNA synthetase